MAKYIKMTDQMAEDARQAFEESLSASRRLRMVDGISFKKNFDAADQRATIYFSEEAWMKTQALVSGFSNEVAWHGVAARVDGTELNEYVISDVVVYPQTVTGATVEMDEENYAKWIILNDGDERFESLRMQGHSHVNMGTSPSPTDIKHQGEILDQLTDDDFYIFMILNKSGSRWATIFDLKKNVMFENNDITVSVIGWSCGMDEFMKEARGLVKAKSYPVTTYGGNAPYRPTAPAQSQNNVGANQTKVKTQIGAGWRGAKNTSQSQEEEDRYNYGWGD